MIECERFAALTDSYLDGSISASDKAILEAHMSVCDRCKSDLEFTKGLYNTLHTLPKLDVPEDFLACLNKRIDEEEAARPAPLAKRILRSRRAYSAAAAGLALALIIGSNPWELIRDTDVDDIEFKDTVIAGIGTPAPSPAAAEPESTAESIPAPETTPQPTAAPVAAVVPETTPKPAEIRTTPSVKSSQPAKTPVKAPEAVSSSPSAQPAFAQAPAEVQSADASSAIDTTAVPANNEIAIPSHSYTISEESDAKNAAKIESRGKLQESYALVESVDNMVFSPDVAQKLAANENIIVNDAVYIQAIQGDTNALSSSVMVSRDDMDAVNKALSVFNFRCDDKCYYMTVTELNQFLNTLDNLGVPYRHNAVNENKQVVLKLITT